MRRDDANANPIPRKTKVRVVNIAGSMGDLKATRSSDVQLTFDSEIVSKSYWQNCGFKVNCRESRRVCRKDGRQRDIKRERPPGMKEM